MTTKPWERYLRLREGNTRNMKELSKPGFGHNMRRALMAWSRATYKQVITRTTKGTEFGTYMRKYFWYNHKSIKLILMILALQTFIVSSKMGLPLGREACTLWCTYSTTSGRCTFGYDTFDACLPLDLMIVLWRMLVATTHKVNKANFIPSQRLHMDVLCIFAYWHQLYCGIMFNSQDITQIVSPSMVQRKSGSTYLRDKCS